jgi:Domain of unknown function (DUF1990)
MGDANGGLSPAGEGVGPLLQRDYWARLRGATLATVRGHPETGRITFGAYRDDDGAVIFHIRSRARSESMLRRLGFVLAGEAMQTNTWTDFLSGVAALCGAEVDGGVRAETRAIEDAADGAIDSPTFLARGG